MTARLAAELPKARIHSRSRLVFDADGGRTRLAVRDAGAPLRVMRGFELADGRLIVQIISAAPGFFSGDRYEIEIEVRRGARAVVLTPAAAKIHSMPDGGHATQSMRAHVGAGASLEIYPTLSIPFPASGFRQEVAISLESNARVGWMDPWSFGRIDRGEKYAFRRIRRGCELTEKGNRFTGTRSRLLRRRAVSADGDHSKVRRTWSMAAGSAPARRGKPRVISTLDCCLGAWATMACSLAGFSRTETPTAPHSTRSAQKLQGLGDWLRFRSRNSRFRRGSLDVSLCCMKNRWIAPAARL
ncbi:MAG: urease accessory protein UreD [Bryobacterales bacterium]